MDYGEWAAHFASQGIPQSGKITKKYVRDRLMGRQRGLCHVCRLPPAPGEVLHLDHDHRCCSKGCIRCWRRLLCRACNTALGRSRRTRHAFTVWPTMPRISPSLWVFSPLVAGRLR